MLTIGIEAAGVEGSRPAIVAHAISSYSPLYELLAGATAGGLVVLRTRSGSAML